MKNKCFYLNCVILEMGMIKSWLVRYVDAVYDITIRALLFGTKERALSCQLFTHKQRWTCKNTLMDLRGGLLRRLRWRFTSRFRRRAAEPKLGYAVNINRKQTTNFTFISICAQLLKITTFFKELIFKKQWSFTVCFDFFKFFLELEGSRSWGLLLVILWNPFWSLSW